jgi:hypothetical protein
LPENWKRYNVDTIKQMFSDWIDNNIDQQYQSYPKFFIKEEDKRFYMRIIEEGDSDDASVDDGYFCLVVPFDTKQVESE